MTNGDRIRQMSDEELAEILDWNRKYKCDYCQYPHIYEEFDCVVNEADCKEGIKAYLESEEEEC